MPAELKRVKCGLCGRLADIKYVQIPTLDLDTIADGQDFAKWECVIECRTCGIRQQTLPKKPAFDNRN